MIFAKYCSPSGSDSNPGTLDAPYQTIQALFDNLSPGENGAIRAGTYSNGVDGVLLNTGETADGTSSSPKRLIGYPDDTRPVLRGIIEIDTDYTSLEQVDVELAPNLGSVLTPLGIGRGNTTTTGSGVVGLRVDGGNSLAQGVLVGGHSVPANNCYVKDSTIHDIKGPASTGPGHGVYYQNGTGGVISGNVFYNIGTGSGGYDGSRGVQIYPLNTGCYVGYNTFENCKGGVVMGDEGTGGSGGHTIERNIFSTITMRAAIGSVGSVSPASTAVDNHFYNCSVGTVTASNTTETGSTTGDPNFVSVATHDYTLSAGSPATGKGATAAPGSGGGGGGGGTLTWTQLTDLPFSVYSASAVELDGVIYVFGSRSSLFWGYTISTDTWTELTPPATYGYRGGSLTVYQSALVHVSTDTSDDPYYNEYDPNTDTWTLTQFSRTALGPDTYLYGADGVPSANVVDGKIYLYSEIDSLTGYGYGFLVFDPATQTCTVTSWSPHRTDYRHCVTDGTTIYLVEGYRGDWDTEGIQPSSQYDTGVMQFYTPATDTWSFSTNTDPNYRNDLSAEYHAGKVYAIGGGSDDNNYPGGYSVPWVSSYDIAADEWTIEDDELPVPLGDPATVIVNDVLYVIGGYDNDTGNQSWFFSAPLPGAGPPAPSPNANVHGAPIVFSLTMSSDVSVTAITTHIPTVTSIRNGTTGPLEGSAFFQRSNTAQVLGTNLNYVTQVKYGSTSVAFTLTYVYTTMWEQVLVFTIPVKAYSADVSVVAPDGTATVRAKVVGPLPWQASDDEQTVTMPLSNPYGLPSAGTAQKVNNYTVVMHGLSPSDLEHPYGAQTGWVGFISSGICWLGDVAAESWNNGSEYVYEYSMFTESDFTVYDNADHWLYQTNYYGSVSLPKRVTSSLPDGMVLMEQRNPNLEGFRVNFGVDYFGNDPVTFTELFSFSEGFIDGSALNGQRGWSTAGAWTVSNGGDGSTGGSAFLRQTTGANAQGMVLALRDDAAHGSDRIVLKAGFTGAGSFDAGPEGLIWGYVDDNNYWFTEWSNTGPCNLGGYLKVGKVSGGTKTYLGQSTDCFDLGVVVQVDHNFVTGALSVSMLNSFNHFDGPYVQSFTGQTGASSEKYGFHAPANGNTGVFSPRHVILDFSATCYPALERTLTYYDGFGSFTPRKTYPVSFSLPQIQVNKVDANTLNTEGYVNRRYTPSSAELSTMGTQYAPWEGWQRHNVTQIDYLETGGTGTLGDDVHASFDLGMGEIAGFTVHPLSADQTAPWIPIPDYATHHVDQGAFETPWLVISQYRQTPQAAVRSWLLRYTAEYRYWAELVRPATTGKGSWEVGTIAWGAPLGIGAPQQDAVGYVYNTITGPPHSPVRHLNATIANDPTEVSWRDWGWDAPLGNANPTSYTSRVWEATYNSGDPNLATSYTVGAQIAAYTGNSFNTITPHNQSTSVPGHTGAGSLMDSITLSGDPGRTVLVSVYPTYSDGTGPETWAVSKMVRHVYDYIGDHVPQMFQVPPGVTTLTASCWGAQGQDAWAFPGMIYGGAGGYIQCDLAVTPLEILYLYVGESPTNVGGGWNGGGNGLGLSGGGSGGAGGTDVRRTPYALSDRLIVAGGGGGAGSGYSEGQSGGHGGPNIGANGRDSYGFGGKGGTQSAGGDGGGGNTWGPDGTAGSLGQGGGTTGTYGYGQGNGGGGGGYYGGGGGGGQGAGGGGGSNHGTGTVKADIRGMRRGHGRVVLAWGTDAEDVVTYLATEVIRTPETVSEDVTYVATEVIRVPETVSEDVTYLATEVLRVPSDIDHDVTYISIEVIRDP